MFWHTVFSVSGVEAPLWLPPLVAFVVSFFSSMAGISGAVLLLPFQVSVLGFISPAVGPTNLVFNIVAIPSGVYRYFRERRMIPPLAWVVVIGTAPGVVLGVIVRLKWLPDPRLFKTFVGAVLLYIGVRMLFEIRKGVVLPAASAAAGDWSVRTLRFDAKRLAFEFQGRVYECGTPAVVLTSLAVGIVGGIYGIGGGAMLAPFFVAILGLPLHAIAGTTLVGTFVTSVAGVAAAHSLAPFHPGTAVAPDWPLGLLFGAGGMAGMYLGARAQRFVPARWLKGLLALMLLAVAATYLGGRLLTR